MECCFGLEFCFCDGEWIDAGGGDCAAEAGEEDFFVEWDGVGVFQVVVMVRGGRGAVGGGGWGGEEEWRGEWMMSVRHGGGERG